ncbi:hypothetical protein Tco_1063493 [Tanacetum coccineum]
MAAPIISISSDSFEESMGSHVLRVILFGAIPAIVPVIPEVPAEVPIVSDDPAPEDSLPSAPALALVLSFLCSDDSKADRSHLAILIRPGEAIPFGRPYRIHPNGPRRLLTTRKRVGPFSARRLAWRRVSHRSSDRHSSPGSTSNSSHSGSCSDSSSDTSSGSPSDSLSDASSVHSSGEAFRRWRSVPLSTSYPPTTSKSSPDSSSERSLDSSSPSGPSRKRYRSPTTSVPSSTPVLRLVAPTHADLLPPHKMFRDSYSPEDSREEHMEIGTADAEAIADLGIGDGVGAHTADDIGMRVEIVAK